MAAGKKAKSQAVALGLSVYLGCLGIDRFYLGQIWQGILKLLTCGGLLVWWIIDIILITMNMLRSNGALLRPAKRKTKIVIISIQSGIIALFILLLIIGTLVSTKTEQESTSIPSTPVITAGVGSPTDLTEETTPTLSVITEPPAEATSGVSVTSPSDINGGSVIVTSPTETPVQTPTQTEEMEASPSPSMPMPANGTILISNNSDCIAPLTVVTQGDASCYIKLVNIDTGVIEIAFFVASNSTADIEVPLGTYEVYYATGTAWYGTEELFGSDTQYYKADDTFEFYQDGNNVYGYTLELYDQVGGNLGYESLSPDEF